MDWNGQLADRDTTVAVPVRLAPDWTRSAVRSKRWGQAVSPTFTRGVGPAPLSTAPSQRPVRGFVVPGSGLALVSAPWPAATTAARTPAAATPPAITSALSPSR